MSAHLEVHVASQNIDHDGPAPKAAVVLTQESAEQIVRDSLPGYRVMVGNNDQLVTAWDSPGYGFLRSYTVPLHVSGQAMKPKRANFTPGRSLFVTEHETDEAGKWATIDTHFVNSAWAPKNKPTSHRRLRRKLWRRSYRILKRTIRDLHRRGFVVILGGDLNRNGRWRIPGMVDLFGSGLGRIWISDNLRIHARSVWRGDKVGDGRVTHKSDNAIIRITKGSS